MSFRLPWKATATPSTGVVVSATELRLRRFRDIPALTWHALRLRGEAASHGALAVGLAAAPLRRTFWTITVWADDHGPQRYLRAPAHAAVMRRFRGGLDGSRSARWVRPQGGRPTWPEAFDRLADAEPGGGSGRTARSASRA